MMDNKTRKELTGIRDLQFSAWIRENCPCSSTGFLVTDIDFFFSNYKTKKCMMLEIKTRNSELKQWQRLTLERLASWIFAGMQQVDKDWSWLGFNVLKFEHTNFQDGKAYWNGVEVSETDVKQKLSF